MGRPQHHSSKKPTKPNQIAPGKKAAAAAWKQAEIQDDGPIFFYLPDADVHGELCQWYRGDSGKRSIFTVSKAEISQLVAYYYTVVVDDDDHNSTEESSSDNVVTFNCTEQFMMYCKAARFHDTVRQARILATSSPKEQKQLGKETLGFWNESWDEVKSAVVVAGNIAKFGQNEDLKRKLLDTGDRLLCEAASHDRVWGIGYTAIDAMSHQNDWGENRLGKALMVVREHFKNEEAHRKEPWELDGQEEED
jgi:ribA/ribD-fused uncharacterized protein